MNMKPFQIEFKSKPEERSSGKLALASKRTGAKEFSKILDEKLNPPEKENSNEKEKNAEEKTNAKEKQEDVKPAVTGKLQESEREFSPLRRLLYELATRDPSTWSLADRQQYHVEQTRMNLQELRKMLTLRELKLSDLSPEELKKACSLRSRQEMSEFLDRLSREAVTSQEQGSLHQGPLARFRTSLTEIERREGVKENEIIRQIVQQIALRKLHHGTEISLVLNPEALGQVRLKLFVDGNQVTAKFETPNRRVSQVIKENLNELQKALSNQGLQVVTLEVEKIS